MHDGATPRYDPMDDIAEVLFDERTIRHRVAEMAAEITAHYRPRWQNDPNWQLLLVSVLRGAIFFVTDLSRSVQLPLNIDFMAITQYGYRRGAGKVRILKDLEDDIRGRDVLIVEDIIDTGLSLGYLLEVLQVRRPRSLQIATLLDRPSLRIVESLPVTFTGFHLDDTFVVGYGLDYRERYRELPFFAVLKDEVFARD